EQAAGAGGRSPAGRARRHPVLVGGADHRAASRRDGFVTALREAGLAGDVLILDEPPSYGAGRRGLDAVLERHPATDAIFFATDVLAVGALLECRRLGLAVPERLAIAGLGDLEIAAELQPALTTLRIPSYEIGRRAGELLLARLDRAELPERRIELGFEIIERESA